MIVFRSLPSVEASARWDELAIVLAPALARVAWAYAPADVHDRLADARMQAFVFEGPGRVHTVCITEVLTFPQARALSVFLIAGDGHDLWKEWLQDLRRCARAMQCRYIIGLDARDGWERAMRDTGMKRTGSIYRMDVCDG